MKHTTLAVTATALAIGAGGGYLAADTVQPAVAQSPPAKTQHSDDSMMGGGMGSMMADPANADHEEMMPRPAMPGMDAEATRQCAEMAEMAEMMSQHAGMAEMRLHEHIQG